MESIMSFWLFSTCNEKQFNELINLSLFRNNSNTAALDRAMPIIFNLKL